MASDNTIALRLVVTDAQTAARQLALLRQATADIGKAAKQGSQEATTGFAEVDKAATKAAESVQGTATDAAKAMGRVDSALSASQKAFFETGSAAERALGGIAQNLQEVGPAARAAGDAARDGLVAGLDAADKAVARVKQSLKDTQATRNEVLKGLADIATGATASSGREGLLAELEAADKAVARVKQSLKETQGVRNEVLSGLADIATAAERVGDEAGTAMGNSMEQSFARSGDITNAMRRTNRQVRGEAESGGGESGRGFISGFSGAMEKFGSVMDGVNQAVEKVAGAVKFTIGSAMDIEASRNKLSAQLNLTVDESERYGKLAGSVYANNYGESIDDVNSSIKSVITNIDGMSAASDEDLSSMVGQITSVSQAFDQDVGQVSIAVGQMLKNGLAKDGKEALDIIAAGFQNGVDKKEDYLDTINEYGTQFRKLGIDGKTATGLLSQGLKGGARDADLVADAFKELSIRVVDGSKTTVDAYESLGLNADDMRTRFAAGGASAAKATQDLMDKLKSVKDPAERARIAVELFGTQAEDLGGALGKLDLKTAASGMGDVAGRAADIDNKMGSGAKAGLEKFMRAIEGIGTMIGTVLMPVVTPLIDFLSGLVNWISPVVEWFGNLDGPIKTVASGLGAWILLNGPLMKLFTMIKVNAVMAFNLVKAEARGGAAAMQSFGVMSKAALIGSGIGIALLAVTAAMSLFSNEGERAEQTVVDFSNAIDQNTGALVSNAAAVVAKDLADQGRFAAAKEAGVNVGLYTKAVMGSTDAENTAKAGMIAHAIEISKTAGTYDQIKSAAELAGDTVEGTVGAWLATGQATGGLMEGMQPLATAYKNLDTDVSAFKGGQEATNAALTAAKDALANTVPPAVDYGTALADAQTAAKALAENTELADKLNGVKLAADKASRATQLFGIEMDRIAGNKRSHEDALVDQAAAIADVQATFEAGTKAATFDDQGNQTAEAGNLNIKALQEWNVVALTATSDGKAAYDSLRALADQHKATAADAYNDAVAHGRTATAVAETRTAADKSRQSFIDMATTQLNISVPAAQAIADKLGLVEGTKLDDKFFSVLADDATAQQHLADLNAAKLGDKNIFVTSNATEQQSLLNTLQTTLGTIQGQRVDYTVVGNLIVAVTEQEAADANAQGASHGYAPHDYSKPLPPSVPQHKARGGYLSGPGTGTSDSIPLWGSNGEFMVTASATARNRPALEAMNAGRYAKGGLITPGGPDTGTPAAAGTAAGTAATAAAAPPAASGPLSPQELASWAQMRGEIAAVGSTWGGVSTTVAGAVSNPITPALTGFGVGLGQLGAANTSLLNDVVIPVWSGIGASVTGTYNGVIVPMVAAMQDGFAQVKTGAATMAAEVTANAKQMAVDVTAAVAQTKTQLDAGSAAIDAYAAKVAAIPTATFSGDGGGGAATGGGVEQWRSTVLEALKRTGQPASLADTVLHQMDTESSGNKAAQNNTDSNAQKGTPSKGLLQVIDPTFATYHDASLGNDIWDPLQNIVAAIRYTIAAYGSVSAGMQGHAYDDGGMWPTGTAGWNTTGKHEAVLTSTETEAYQAHAKNLASPGSGSNITVSPGAVQITVQGNIDNADQIREELEKALREILAENADRSF